MGDYFKHSAVRMITAVFVTLLTVVGLQLSICLAAGTAPTEGDGTADSPYLIGTASELVWFRDTVNEGNTGICAKLTADIDISGVGEWTPIGNSSKMYSGTFEGNGHTISGMSINVNDTTNDNVGLFGVTSSATVGGFTIKGNIAHSANITSVAGAVAHAKNTRIHNINSSVNINVNIAGNINDPHNRIAGIVAYYEPPLSEDDPTISVEQCVNYGDINVTSDGSVILGGVVAYAGADSKDTKHKMYITSCANFGNLVSYATTSENLRMGGILGIVNAKNYRIYISGCYNFGTVESKVGINTGALVGYIKEGDNYTELGKNNYWLDTSCIRESDEKSVGVGDGHYKTDGFVESKTAEQFASGEVTYLINSCLSGEEPVWYQTIGSDDYPVMANDRLTVYAFNKTTDDTTITAYENFVNEDDKGLVFTVDDSNFKFIIDTTTYGGEGDALYLEDMDVYKKSDIITYEAITTSNNKPFGFDYTDATEQYAVITLSLTEVSGYAANDDICAVITAKVGEDNMRYFAYPVTKSKE
jgi:hypothetical protein